ncbi:MAG: hypothetical protein HS132_06255 [Planctomycetia bacterium]|nr:hypothetical protein [Planctomycetia bacterium]
MRIRKKINYYSLLLALAVIAQLIYLNSLSNQFTYDDEFAIVSNYFIKSWKHLPLLFTRKYFEYSGELSYRPVVTLLSYFLDYALWQLNPFDFISPIHFYIPLTLFSFLLVHAVIQQTCCFFYCSSYIFLSPLLSETVDVISYREDLLRATFYNSVLPVPQR